MPWLSPDGGMLCAAHKPLHKGCYSESGGRGKGEDRDVTLHGRASAEY